MYSFLWFERVKYFGQLFLTLDDSVTNIDTFVTTSKIVHTVVLLETDI
jgi:hypothetical protein